MLHLDEGLADIMAQYGTATYLIICLILFCETGLVVTPFLPGDTLLFATGAITASTGILQIELLLPLMVGAVLMGDNLNYFIGRKLGVKLFEVKALKRILKRKYLTRTEKFFEKYGKQTIILARYVPIVRTFTPFVAGVGHMRYIVYLTYCIVGGVTWVCSLTLLGYFFGNIPIVRDNFELVIITILILSFLPPVIQFLRLKWKERKLAN